MIFLIESIIACAVFTFFVYLISRNPVKIVFNYPPAIIERCRSLGLVNDSNRRGGTVFYAKKITAIALFGVVLGLLVRYINGCTDFWSGALTAYALWSVVNWFDALVLDCLWFCHDKHFVIPWTEDMVKTITTTGSTSRAPLSACCSLSQPPSLPVWLPLHWPDFKIICGAAKYK